jgi:hypothetical protein
LESTIIGSLAITSLTRFDVTGSSLSSDNRSAPRAESAVRALRDLYVRANIHSITPRFRTCFNPFPFDQQESRQKAEVQEVMYLARGLH